MNAGDGFIDFWNQPHGWKYFLVEFGFWGCCGFPVRLRGSRAPVRAPVVERSLRLNPCTSTVVPASWTRTVAVVCTSRSRLTGASESFSVSVVIRTVLVDPSARRRTPVAVVVAASTSVSSSTRIEPLRTPHPWRLPARLLFAQPE